MKYFFLSLWRNFSFFLRKGIIYPLLIALAVTLAYLIVMRLIKGKTPKPTKTIGFLSVSYFYIFPLELAVLSRLSNEKVNPVSKIFGGWVLEKAKYSFDFQPIENLLLFTPFAIALCFFLIKFKGSSRKTLVLSATLLSLLMSLIIECTQLILCIGTFQISDLVYNTLSGLIGAIIVLFINKKRALSQ